jgi:SAM-dependent methyltransferase
MPELRNPFDSCSEQYDRFRPGYPDEVIETILRSCDGLLVDVGAGTGKAGAPFASRGIRVVSIEPSLPMIRQGVRSYPKLLYVCANAEELPMASGVVSSVICAQAFHWLDAPRALKEFARVLKPGGHIHLFWNTRDQKHPAPKLFDELTRKWNPSHEIGYRRKNWADRISDSASFTEIIHQSFHQTRRMTAKDWIGLSRSISYIQSIGPEKVAGFEADLAQGLSSLTSLDCPYVTEMWSAKK